MTSLFKNKTVLVTGGTGSIGSEIVRQLLVEPTCTVRVLSRDEHKQFVMQQELGMYENVRYFLGDVRDFPRMLMAMENVDIVFHCAAYKHVPFCEYNSFEAVKTNVIGTQNVIDACLQRGVKRMLLVSTDKAASPTNVMGATKLLAEKMMTSAMFSKGMHPTLFSSVRFGNVLGSRGSVIPTFCEQIKKGGPVTITSPTMTRFFMSIPEAVKLTFTAMEHMEGGEVFILKMPVVQLDDLVESLIEELAPAYSLDPKKIERKVVGSRPGEKTYEMLMTVEEAPYAKEVMEMFVVRSPLEKTFGYTPMAEGTPASQKQYSSAELKPMPRTEVRKLIAEHLKQAKALPGK